MNVSYITQVKEIVGLPVSAVFLKPTIEYGDKWGFFADNLYASIDCNDSVQTLQAEIGLNCFNAAPFYRFNINKFNLAGGIGVLRIDIAGLLSGKYGTTEFSDVIDEGRTGVYGSIRAGFNPVEQLRIKSSFGSGIVKDGSFLEIGASCMFNPFKKENVGTQRAVSLLKNHIFLSVGLSFMRLEVKMEEIPYSTFMGNYLIGIAYEQ